MNTRLLPKIELHLHLDCSLSYKVVSILNPAISEDEYLRDFTAPAHCHDLVEYIAKASKAVELMQTKEQLRLVTLDLFEQLKADNVIYAEMRFAPLLHTAKGLTPEEVVHAVNDAATEGIKRSGVMAGIILCTLRHFSVSDSMRTVSLVEKFKGTNIAGFDIAADEAGFPVDNHIEAFNYARANQIHCTAHAGEAKGPESVWETLKKFHPSRIGHGVRCIEDPDLVAFMKERNIHIEVCPTSNVQTNIYHEIKDHAADKLYKSGLSMSINTDSRTVSPVTLSGEYDLLQRTFNWDKEHFLHCNMEAINHAFTSEQIKMDLRKRILEGFAR